MSLLNRVSWLWKPGIIGHLVSWNLTFSSELNPHATDPAPDQRTRIPFEERSLSCQAGGGQITPSLGSGTGRGVESSTFRGALPRTTSQFEPQRNPNWEKHSHWGNRTSFVVPLRWSQPSFHKVMLQIPSAFLHFLIIVSLGKIPTSQHPGISFPKIQLQSPFKWFFEKIIIIF